MIAQEVFGVQSETEMRAYGARRSFGIEAEKCVRRKLRPVPQLGLLGKRWFNMRTSRNNTCAMTAQTTMHQSFGSKLFTLARP